MPTVADPITAREAASERLRIAARAIHNADLPGVLSAPDADRLRAVATWLDAASKQVEAGIDGLPTLQIEGVTP